MPIIVRTTLAKIDVADIWDYIADDSEARADGFIASIDKRLEAIAASPNIGRMRDELENGLRSFPVGRYLIFYRKITDGIEVIRVLHGATDIETLF